MQHLLRRKWAAMVALCLLALVAPRTSRGEGWAEERAFGPFQCHADFSLQPHLELMSELATLQEDVTRTLGVAAPRERIHLFLFEQQATYRRYIRHYFPDVPYRRALFVKARGPGMVFAHLGSDFEIDVRHECTHALLHAALPMVPLWLDEGLAEYFEMPREQRPYDHSHLGPTRWAVRFGRTPSIAGLEGLRELSEMGRTEYRHAWSWVHFMLHSSAETHGELVDFLNDIQAHTPPGKLSERLARRVPGVESKYREHFRHWQRS